MSRITQVRIALPAYKYSPSEILSATSHWLMSESHERELFERFVSSSRITSRYFVLPVQEILQQRSNARRATIFAEHGTVLSMRAAEATLKAGRVHPTEVSDLIFTSCSVPTIPAIDTRVVNELGISPTVRRIPVYQHGCAGGAVGLTLACSINRGSTLLLATELCSLVFQASDFSGGNLVGSALFGDGAAGVLIQAHGAGLEMLACESYLIPNSDDMMGYDIKDDGAHLRLKRELPMVLANEAPQRIHEFLKGCGLEVEEVSAWLIHPGGVKILEALESALSIQRPRSRYAWDVLAKFGNMSSATILFVLNEYLNSGQARAGERVMLVGVGPGLTLELGLFEYKSGEPH
ncbi:MAG: hypothetical protein K1X79_03400 [Oligoflexia bacterium]|nr:hypothetical protein [Oligoflexia bacterium]